MLALAFVVSSRRSAQSGKNGVTSMPCALRNTLLPSSGMKQDRTDVYILNRSYVYGS